jgi:hypothetical protein
MNTVNDTTPTFVVRRGGAFGDKLLSAMFTRALKSAGINAICEIDYNYVCDDLKLNREIKSSDLIINFVYEPYIEDAANKKNLTMSFLEKVLKNANPILKKYLAKETINKIDVTKCFPIIKDLPVIEKTNDVFVITSAGPWSNVRNYPRFQELFNLFNKNNISYVNVTKEKLIDEVFFECFAKSKIFIGLETGATHLAAQFLNKNNSLILQSGFVPLDFWAKHYDVDYIALSLSCSPCGLRNTNSCKYNHACMYDITPESILEKIINKLQVYGK